MVERKKKQPRNRTHFRRTLNKLMVERDIFTWKELRGRLEESDYEIGQPRLSQYLNGQRDPEDLEDFFEAIARTLDLNEDEKMRLAYAYAYPGNASNRGPTDETVAKAQEAEEIIRGAADDSVSDEGTEDYRTEGHRT